MNIKQQLRNNFPNTIDKTSREFCAIVANDKGNAVMEKILTDMKSYMEEWVSNTSDIYDQEDSMLEKTNDFISFFTRFTSETDTMLKNRIAAIFKRKGDTQWGTIANIKNVFKQYFSGATVYLIENSRDNETYNLIENGDFDSEDSWTFNNCERSEKACFMSKYGVEFNDADDVLSQSIELTNSTSETYVLHFFLKGKIGVVIKDGDSNYWNDTEKAWTTESYTNEFSADDWTNITLWCLAGSGVTSLTVSFTGLSTDTAYIDYVRLFAKPNFGCFTILLHYEGETGGNALNLAPGSSDPDESIDYSQVGYYDQIYMSGASSGVSSSGYNQLLELVRPIGVQANLEIIIKES